MAQCEKRTKQCAMRIEHTEEIYEMKGIIMKSSRNECMPSDTVSPSYVPVFFCCCLPVGADNVKIEFDASMVVKIAILCAHLISFDIFYTAVRIEKRQQM